MGKKYEIEYEDDKIVGVKITEENESEKIAKKRKRYITAKYVSAGVSAASILCSIACLFSSTSKSLDNRELMNELSDMIRDVKQSEAYIDYINQESGKLYYSYKFGELTGIQYGEEINKLHSDEYVLENGYRFVKDDKFDEISSIDEKIEKNKKDSDSLVLASVASLIGVTGPAAITSICTSEKVKNMEM